jgi:hypothetical protein
MPASDDQILVKLTADVAAGIPYQDDVISLLPADIRALWPAVMPGMTLDRALRRDLGRSAIVAGAAISLQGMHRARHGAFLTSAEVRGLLKDLNLNTSPSPADVGRLGAMPDLERLAQHIGAT